jgi:hypothetical protein
LVAHGGRQELHNASILEGRFLTYAGGRAADLGGRNMLAIPETSCLPTGGGYAVEVNLPDGPPVLVQVVVRQGPAEELVEVRG